MKVSRSLLASFPWTHYVRIEKAESGRAKISSRYFDGKRLTRPTVETHEYNTLLPLAQHQGQWSWAQIAGDYLSDYSPPYSGIDKISWYHLRRNKYAIEELFRAWATLSTITPVTVHNVTDGVKLTFTEGVCRLHQSEPRYSLQNGLLVTRSLPRTIVDGISNMPMSQVIDSPLFPSCAIAVEASGNDEVTQIRYDVEVVDLEDIFGKKSRLLTKDKWDAIQVHHAD